ncbi:serine/threonine protein kinase [Corallococcus praedator]|uniref:Serine/threonine protein kinase n=1 Tax=Corallococcus praedator TaxID=2316724 RepID=A0ABX9QA55_9BACT|nr:MULTISPECIES: serine/threonine-protein kinase [Corallococcus]RKH03691.1 serine/threonine protein kinase [Corallococcus sp. CA047B]RKH21748.1 serine/threonine protein kinase [Corallococcus sp. CA031C]RKH94227.1 serine/threonine protein kinase [Corallococcus praedator]
MTGELLAGRYQLEQELGRGGMATVFLARDLRLSRRVAVKVLHPGLDPGLAERFRREAEVVASLKHPNVLEVHDFGEDSVRGPFLVCEWVQGENLRELARRLSPVPPEVAALLGWELARALEAAHARGVVHRDVKPENVLVALGGPLKLADFGIAALADQARLTSTGAVIGSLAYMAPERIDTGAWSPASDVFAVGVVLFELCAGMTPHSGAGSARLAVSVMTRDAPLLSEVVPGTPEVLGALVARCLARDARDRPRDGAELTVGLEEVLRSLVGSPSEASRAFFVAPEDVASGWREARFQRLLGEGRALLAAGQGAQAARYLNVALSLRPGAPEVLSLLRTRPRTRRTRVLVGSALLSGLLVSVGAWVALRETTQTPSERATVVTDVAPTPSPPASRSNVTVPEPDAPLPARSPPGKMTPGGAEVRPDAVSSSAQKPRVVPSRRLAPPQTSSAQAPLPPATATVPTSDPSPAPAQGFATLTVVTRPWAEVFVDGQSRGYTPRIREVRLSPGTHRLRFDNPLCEPVEEVLQVAAGETVSRNLSLRVLDAEVTLVAPVAARIFVDGVEVGVAPLRGPLKLAHGAHVLSARGPGGLVLRQTVDAVAGTRTTVVLGSPSR